MRDDIFVVSLLAHPPVESRRESIQSLAGLDLFGGLPNQQLIVWFSLDFK